MANNYTHFSFCVEAPSVEAARWLRQAFTAFSDAAEELREHTYHSGPIQNETIEEHAERADTQSQVVGQALASLGPYFTPEQIQEISKAEELWIDGVSQVQTTQPLTDLDVGFFDVSGEANTEALLYLLQAYVRRWEPKGYVTFTVADTCSSPRYDQFGGGVCLITADEVEWESTQQRQKKMVARFEKKMAAKTVPATQPAQPPTKKKRKKA
jgi:hypothetical protein